MWTKRPVINADDIDLSLFTINTPIGAVLHRHETIRLFNRGWWNSLLNQMETSKQKKMKEANAVIL